MIRAFWMAVLALACWSPAAWPEGGPVATASAFQQALAAGDEAAALRLLAPGLLVYESGGQESSRDEYAAHHLKADIAFLKGAKVEHLGQLHGSSGDQAWVTTRTRIRNTYKGKPVDLASTETLVLHKEDDAWQIIHIHWSSQPYREPAAP